MRKNTILVIVLLIIFLLVFSGCGRIASKVARNALNEQAAEERRAQLQATLDKALSTGDIALCEELKDEGGIYSDCLMRSSYVTGDPSTCESIPDEKTRTYCEAVALHDSHYITFTNDDLFECGSICRQLIHFADSDLVNNCEDIVSTYVKCEDKESCWLSKGTKIDPEILKQKECYGSEDMIDCLIKDSKQLSHCKDTYLIKTWQKHGKFARGASK